MPPHAPGPIARWLSEDHARLDALLRQATARPDGIDALSYGSFRGGLLRHIGIEEKILLPAAQRAQGEALAVAGRLRLDHGALAALLVPTPTASIVATIRAILTGHNALEEGAGGLYATCDTLLARDAEAIVRAMAAFPDVRAAPHNDGPDVAPALRRALARAGYDLADHAVDGRSRVDR